MKGGGGEGAASVLLTDEEALDVSATVHKAAILGCDWELVLEGLDIDGLEANDGDLAAFEQRDPHEHNDEEEHLQSLVSTCRINGRAWQG